MRMTKNILRDVIIIGVVAILSVVLFNNRTAVYDILRVNPADHPRSAAAEPTEIKTVSAETPRKTGTVVSIPKSKSDGQYWTDARVNSGHVRFLIDTGASAVALTLDDARKSGIRTHDLEFNVPVSTAGGTNMAAFVNLKSISVGAITIRNIDALIIPEGLDTSLLGMTYLGELQKVEATPNALLLRL